MIKLTKTQHPSFEVISDAESNLVLGGVIKKRAEQDIFCYINLKGGGSKKKYWHDRGSSWNSIHNKCAAFAQENRTIATGAYSGQVDTNGKGPAGPFNGVSPGF